MFLIHKWELRLDSGTFPHLSAASILVLAVLGSRRLGLFSVRREIVSEDLLEEY